MASSLDTARMFAPRAYAPQASRTLMKTRLVKKTMIYTFPTDLSEEELLSTGLAFMLMGTNTTASLEEWKSYVCSYTCFLIPEMRGKLALENYAYTAVSKASMAPILARLQTYIDKGLAEEEDNNLSDTGLVNITLHAGLPAASAPSGYKWVGAEATMKHIYAHYSLVVFLAGKIITDVNRAAITENRPGAIIGKCNLDEETLTLVGALRLSDPSHTYIHAAWAEMTTFRAACFLEFMNYASMNVNFAQDIIYTSVHLLRYTGLTHARFAYKLLKANPWVREFPPLQGSVTVFEDSLRESMKVPSLLQPYLKLIFADKSNLFPRKEMEPLVACAVAIEEQMSDTVQQFYRSDKYAAIVDLFMDERQQRSSIGKNKGKITTLAELEETSDVEYEQQDDGTPDEEETPEQGEQEGAPVAEIQ